MVAVVSLTAVAVSAAPAATWVVVARISLDEEASTPTPSLISRVVRRRLSIIARNARARAPTSSARLSVGTLTVRSPEATRSAIPAISRSGPAMTRVKNRVIATPSSSAMAPAITKTNMVSFALCADAVTATAALWSSCFTSSSAMVRIFWLRSSWVPKINFFAASILPWLIRGTICFSRMSRNAIRIDLNSSIREEIIGSRFPNSTILCINSSDSCSRSLISCCAASRSDGLEVAIIVSNAARDPF